MAMVAAVAMAALVAMPVSKPRGFSCHYRDSSASGCGWDQHEAETAAEHPETRHMDRESRCHLHCRAAFTARAGMQEGKEAKLR
jgi:hypothetical protein